MEFRCVGLKTREDYHDGNGLLHRRIFDGELDLRYDAANRQVSVHAPGGSHVHRTTLREFRNASWLASGRLAVMSTDSDGRVRIKALRAEMDPDWNTGFIHRAALRDANGQVTSEIAQFHPVTYPGNIVFPTILARLSYRSGKLDRVGCLVIDSARFNEGFASDEFVMAVPEGTLIIDYREDDFRPGSHTLREDVSDLAAHIKQHWPVAR